MKTRNVLMILGCALMAACSAPEKGPGIDGHVRGEQYEGKQVYLTNPYSYTDILDSALIEKGRFSITLPDSVQIYALLLRESEKDLAPIILPIIGGEGRVKAYLGTSVLTSGTKANDALQDFLLAGDNMYNKMLKMEAPNEEIAKVYKDFLKEQILINKNNLVGVYILNSYRDRFFEDEVALIKEQIAPSLWSFIK